MAHNPNTVVMIADSYVGTATYAGNSEDTTTGAEAGTFTNPSSTNKLDDTSLSAGEITVVNPKTRFGSHVDNPKDFVVAQHDAVRGIKYSDIIKLDSIKKIDVVSASEATPLGYVFDFNDISGLAVGDILYLRIILKGEKDIYRLPINVTYTVTTTTKDDFINGLVEQINYNITHISQEEIAFTAVPFDGSLTVASSSLRYMGIFATPVKTDYTGWQPNQLFSVQSFSMSVYDESEGKNYEGWEQVSPTASPEYYSLTNATYAGNTYTAGTAVDAATTPPVNANGTPQVVLSEWYNSAFGGLGPYHRDKLSKTPKEPNVEGKLYTTITITHQPEVIRAGQPSKGDNYKQLIIFINEDTSTATYAQNLVDLLKGLIA